MLCCYVSVATGATLSWPSTHAYDNIYNANSLDSRSMLTL